MRFDGTFRAPASRWDTSMDERMGRPLAGFFGAGHLEIAQGSVAITARRHRYAANLVGGVVFALLFGVLAAFGLQAESTHPGRTHADPAQGGPVLLLFGFVFGAFLTSLVFRFTKPITVTVPFTELARVKVVSNQIRFFRSAGGDIEINLRTVAEVHALMSTLAAQGVATR